ncbi:MAG: hypothetical protein DWG82_03205 [Chloroflexi bacterium]|nr:hypothetical protein [Chloroflexota bacterium]
MTKAVLSFDVDGILEIGEPPGPITIAMVKRAVELGYAVGSCSDRPLGLQRLMWEQLGIDASFVVSKHKMADIWDKVEADEYYHVGVAERDTFYTGQAEFTFVHAYMETDEPWMRDAAGELFPRYTDRLSMTERARIDGN